MDKLTESARKALIQETTQPGMFVPLWRIAERLSRTGTKVLWPNLVNAVDDLEAYGIAKVSRRNQFGEVGRTNANTGLMFAGVIIFDPADGARVIPRTPLDQPITLEQFAAFILGGVSTADFGITLERITLI